MCFHDLFPPFAFGLHVYFIVKVVHILVDLFKFYFYIATYTNIKLALILVINTCGFSECFEAIDPR
jgi:hypothetical protein